MKKVIERFGLILFGIFLAVMLAEIGLRIVYPYSHTKFYRRHPVLGWELIPDKEDVAFSNVFEFQTKIKINSLGLRDDEIDFSDKEKKVILVLGDSYTYAEAVEQEKTFVEILQKKLSLTLKKNIEVINAGRNGYGTAQEFLLYKELVNKGLKPDLVLLMFFTNDIINNLCLEPSTMEKRLHMPCFQIEGDALELVQLPSFPISEREQRWWSKFFSESRLYQLTYWKLFYFATNHPKIISFLKSLGFHIKSSAKPTILSAWYSDHLQDGWRLTKKLIKNLKKQVEEDGGQLVVVFIPSVLQFSQNAQKLMKLTFDIPEVGKFFNNPKKPQRLIATFCNDNKIPVIDLLPVFERTLVHNEKVSSFYFLIDGHWTPRGHFLVADYIMENGTILSILKGK